MDFQGKEKKMDHEQMRINETMIIPAIMGSA